MTTYSAEYNVHGVVLMVTADDRQLHEASAYLLHPFACTHPQRSIARNTPAWHVTLRSCGAPFECRWPDGRQWFTLSRMQCFGNDESVTVVYAGVPIARLEHTTRSIEAWIPSELGINQWDIGHALLLPLLVEVWRRHGLFHVHAAALADASGRVALFPAESGSGKTTLTVALARAGFAYLTDDAPLLARGQHEAIVALGFPEPLNVTEAASRFFPELHDHWRGDACNPRDKAPINCALVYGTRLQASGPVTALFFPEIGAADQTEIEPLNTTDALFALLSHTLPSSKACHTAEQFELFSDLVERAPSYRVRVGRDFEILPHHITHLLAAASSSQRASSRVAGEEHAR